jgi:hypothetical protein
MSGAVTMIDRTIVACAAAMVAPARAVKTAKAIKMDFISYTGQRQALCELHPFHASGAGVVCHDHGDAPF